MYLSTKPSLVRRWLLCGMMVLAVAMTAAIEGAATMPVAAGSNGPATPSLGHRIVYQVSSNDPAAMQHALSSADNAMKYYRSHEQQVTIEIVANGSGVHMLRADTTPVAPALQYMRKAHPDLILSVCGVTKALMEAKEGRALALVEGSRVVPSGIVRVVELQEQGYAYIKP